jgi:integrase/recombinase XerD
MRHELDPWLEGYLSYLTEVRRMNPRTVRDVRCTLKGVGTFMAARKPDRPLWKLPLEDFLSWLRDAREKGWSERTLAKQLCHVRGLLDYAWRSGRADRNVLDGFTLEDKSKRIEPRSLTLAEAERLVRTCPRSTAQERRHRLIVLLLYGCGLRTNELCQLDVQDVNVERQELFIRKGKGDRQRTIPAPPSVWTELLAYLLERGGKRGALFRTAIKGARIPDEEVGLAVSVAAQRAGIAGKITPRTLRHSFGTHLMDAGVDIAIIASLMGHRSPNETGVYLHVLPGKKEAAVQSLLGTKEDAT